MTRLTARVSCSRIWSAEISGTSGVAAAFAGQKLVRRRDGGLAALDRHIHRLASWQCGRCAAAPRCAVAAWRRRYRRRRESALRLARNWPAKSAGRGCGGEAARVANARAGEHPAACAQVLDLQDDHGRAIRILGRSLREGAERRHALGIGNHGKVGVAQGRPQAGASVKRRKSPHPRRYAPAGSSQTDVSKSQSVSSKAAAARERRGRHKAGVQSPRSVPAAPWRSWRRGRRLRLAHGIAESRLKSKACRRHGAQSSPRTSVKKSTRGRRCLCAHRVAFGGAPAP